MTDPMTEDDLKRREASWALAFGCSYEFPSEVVDCIRQWWSECRDMIAEVRRLRAEVANLEIKLVGSEARGSGLAKACDALHAREGVLRQLLREAQAVTGVDYEWLATTKADDAPVKVDSDAQQRCVGGLPPVDLQCKRCHGWGWDRIAQMVCEKCGGSGRTDVFGVRGLTST